MPKAPKKVAPVPEHVLKKRKAQDAIAAARAAKLVEDKKASKIERKAIFDKAALAHSVHPDECTWCIAEKGTELQLLLAATSDARWGSLLKEE